MHIGEREGADEEALSAVPRHAIATQAGHVREGWAVCRAVPFRLVVLPVPQVSAGVVHTAQRE